MSRGNSRVACLVALHFSVLCLMPSKAPSTPMDVEALVADAPSASEIALFEELVEWIGAEDAASVAGTEPLRQIIRARPASFDVFRSYHDDTVRNERLDTVPFGGTIRRTADRLGVDGLLVAAIIEAESSFDPCAISHRGAIGLMQVMPAHVSSAGLDRLSEPDFNIEMGTRYLRHLLKLYEGDLELALAAYNAGPANVRRYGGVPPFRETRQYVEKVLGIYVGHHQEIWRKNGTGEMLASVGTESLAEG